MPFGLKNAPRIYQRLVDNALYGFLTISRSGDAGATTDVFQTGIADDPDRESVLGRRSYIDDIMIAAESWDQMCQRVEDLLEHRVSIGGLEVNPKDLKSLNDLPFPGSLRSMQSFLGSLNYYSRFIEDYAIYALVLYELREVEFAELEKRSDLRDIMDRNDPIPRNLDPPLTVNEEEYNGLILGLDMLEDLDHKRLVVCGDSNLVIRQVRGEIDCKAPGLTLLKRKALDRLRKWRDHELVHVKRDWNGSADSLASAALQRQGGIEVRNMPGYQDLPTLNRKGKPVIRGESPGNLQATYPFQIIAMEHIPSLPRSHKGNTELLIWVDLFTGYVIAKASSSRSAQTVAESALKMYVRDLDQKDWDEYAERLSFAINTAHDRIRGDTPHYLVHGWDLRSTLEATLPQSREQDNSRLKEAIADRAGRHNEDVGSHQIEAGSRIWLYLDRVKEGYARKLVHLWHGPFRVAEKINEFSVKLEIAGTGYQIFPVVHVSKLKLVKDFSDRPRVELTVDEADRLNFDEILLPEDSWVPDLGADEYEAERISDVRSGKKTRFGRIYREFLVHWVGYDETTWVDEADLNCGAILIAFLQERANRNRFNVMQSHEKM
ncbi:hypothetical protein PHMEG_00019572 [Phytophthora megakarya]|uniref:Chromo domain-containing protein n=1 Tax=Phytophthora megakarya TaxID=4795 RepID=A0A225VS33_9STRA|nr:hypothetical protein PHMEG_00019572 [Phytophthora megakarya]